MKKIYFHSEIEKYGELSNFYEMEQPIVFRGKLYKTSEHLYQALKYLYFDENPLNIAFAEEIRKTKTPNMAKFLASLRTTRKYTWQDHLSDIVDSYVKRGLTFDKRWDSVRVQLMEDVLKIKFESCSRCMNVLRSTVGYVLVEHTATDSFWGDGGNEKGENKLGKLLMKLRELYVMGIVNQLALLRC